MIGAEIWYDGSVADATKVAEGFAKKGIHFESRRRGIWEWRGGSAPIAKFVFSRVSIYHDGRTVFVSLAGDKLPRKDFDVMDLWEAIGLQATPVPSLRTGVEL